MHYWNQDNFEGLRSVGEQYSSIPGYALFGRYCLEKESGLKKQASASIRAFVADAESRSTQEQRAIAEDLSSLGFFNQHIHQLLAHPVLLYLRAVLEKWATDQPGNPVPHKWLGYIVGDLASYRRALELSPSDAVCLSQLAQAHLNDVDYQTHHLSESLFLGDPATARDSLERAKELIARMGNSDRKDRLQTQAGTYTRLLACWSEYSNLDLDVPFPDWCASKGEQFSFWSIVYYQ